MCVYAEWLGIFCKGNVEFLPFHSLDVAVKDCWELIPDVGDGSDMVGGRHGEA